MRPRLHRLLACVLTTALVGSVSALVAAPASAANSFGQGNIVVARVGDGSAALSNAATPVFLDELTPDGTLVQSVPLPTASAGGNRRLTLSGSATSEGALARSADGRYLTLGGYDADPGLTGVASSATSAVPRVVGRIDGGGAVDSSTAITDAFNANNIRGAVTDDGSRFWSVGGNGGVRLSALGSSGASTAVNSAAPTNIRSVSIADGKLYVSTGSGTTGVYQVGSGLPTASGSPTALVQAAPSPYAFMALDRDAGVPGVDTLYVADDSGSPNGGILKFSSDGSTWTARGSFRPAGNGVRGLTGSGGTLFATTTAGQLVKVDDSASFNAPIAATGTVLRTAAANTALRGVALAPTGTTVTAPAITDQPQDATVASGGTATLNVAATGTGPLQYRWYQGEAGDTANQVGSDSGFTTPALTATAKYWVRITGPGGSVDSRTATVTVSSAPNTAPTITPNAVPELALTIGDPDNPPAVRTVTVADAQTSSSGLTVSVTSADAAIATGGVTGDGDTRTLTVNPAGVGQTTLTITVSDGSLTASTTMKVSVSGALPAGVRNLYGASDASTAQLMPDGSLLVADDETNVLRSYDPDHSRYPSSTFDVRAAGLALRDGDPAREIDIEASARRGDQIFWIGSQGQNSSAKTRLNRQELFTTKGSGSGLSLGGSYQHLRDDLITWDQSNGDALGLGAAAVRAPEGDGSGGPTGFNIEGAEFGNDGNTLLLAFRGPLTSDNKAIVIPVTNAADLVAGNPTTGVSANFGGPLKWDLGGRGIREIKKNAANQYLIIAGPSDDGALGFRFYTWDGDASHQPIPRAGDLSALPAIGKPEAIVDVPNPLTPTATVRVLTDSGDTVFYGNGTIAKELPLDERKATSWPVSLGAAPACTSPTVSIGSVQGTGDVSPVAGQTVSVRGTVVGDYEGASPALRGFYLQDSGDGNPATSDGIFVFTNAANSVSVGDNVQVTGSVSEFQGQTQLTPGQVEACGSSSNVTPTDVTLPNADPQTLEKYEGMLVRFHQQLTVTEHFQLGRFGQVVVSSGGRLRQPTADIRATDTAAVQAKQQANDLNRLIIDDPAQSQNPDPIVFGRGGQPLSASNTLRGGDTVTDPVGVLTYTWSGNAASGNAYRLRPGNALGGAASFDVGNERPAAPPAVGAGGIKVASANLLNFFTQFTGCTFGTQGGPADCRGANNQQEYQRQLAKEVASLRFLNADVIGYMEMQNNGYGSASAVQALVNALNAVDGPGSWAFVDPDAATGVADVAGTDAIKAGLLYRTAAVSPVPGKTFVDQNAVFERRPVAQTFSTGGGARFTVVANHFKSKGSCPASGPDTDQHDGQACWNARRTQQATELANWVGNTVIPAADDPDVLIVGDLNAYAGEDPVAVLESAGYVNLIKQYQGAEAYSYGFDGQWGYLDHALASVSLAGQATGAGDAHHNADEPSVLDYNTEFKTPGQVSSLYAPDRFRTSDHDPVVIGLDPGAPVTVSGTPGAGTVGQAYNFTFGLSDTAITSVSAGSLPPGLSLNANGVLSGTPVKAGDFAFTVRATNRFGRTDYPTSVHVDKGVPTVTVGSSASPSTVGAAVRFTATVPGSGTVQFTVDGVALGGPVTVTAGKAASQPISTLKPGAHQVQVVYSGDADWLTGTGSFSQLVQYKVKVVLPPSGASWPAGLPVPIAFQLQDAGGKNIPFGDAVSLTLAGRVTVSASGAQSLASAQALYEPLTGTFGYAWLTKPGKRGAVTVSITVTYPGAPDQVVTVPITLK
ncbi:ExeM/NucH family extracellular endonuclease [Pseudonocardiaceae bacterium YIM PH 21723]|nr:ExeM/NucH family extracellular endonuclease [Pseudonocardiaceae bacterium YIM PH 21723]